MIRALLPVAVARYGLLVLVSVTLLGCTGQVAAPAAYRAGTPPPQPYAMPDRTLTDAHGRPYNLRTSPSRPVTLLFFGYTHCPDVCTTVLSDLAMALQRVDPPVRARVQVVVVTTDPARDDGARLQAYLDRFDPDFVGLTGSLSTVKDVAGRVGVDISGRRRLPSGGYEVGHSAQVIGFDRGRGVVLWTPDTSVTDLAADVALLAERAR